MLLSAVAATFSPIAFASSMDFGGMYGMGGPMPGHFYPNPITGGAFCPTGYTAYLGLGTGNVDWPLYWCGRPHIEGSVPDYDFGGLYSYASAAGNGALPWRNSFSFVNPFTHTDSCPDGYTSSQVFGTAQVDNALYFCYRQHMATGPSMTFGGMTGDGATPRPNPMTGTPYTCPQGYKRYTGYGDPGKDYTFYYCGIKANISSAVAGNGSLGIGDPLVSDTIQYGYSLQERLDGLIALRPRVVRMWMKNIELFTGLAPDQTLQRNTPNVLLYHTAVDELTQAGITVVGMDSYFPPWLLGNSNGRLPCRDTNPGSAYEGFLDRWEILWEAEAEEFPTINQWEVGNELNMNLPSSCTGGKFSYDDTVLINLDLMYRGNRGIKSANPQAIVYMPAVAPFAYDSNGNATYDSSLAGIGKFIDDLYKKIANHEGPSTSKRDYFDGANWHPYIYQDATQETWVNANQRIYDVIVKNGDANIPVIFSENGFTTPNDASSAQFMDDALHLTQTSLPWVRYTIWFRALWSPALHDGSQYAILVGYPPFTRTQSASVFCRYTGCDNIAPW
ncbi:MAG: hypothetical protein ACYC0F_09550 [Rhodanobacter sp.]